MKKIFTKMYSTSKEELFIDTLGLFFVALSTAYLIAYAVIVG
jgi:hypothetical protein